MTNRPHKILLCITIQFLSLVAMVTKLSVYVQTDSNINHLVFKILLKVIYLPNIFLVFSYLFIYGYKHLFYLLSKIPIVSI